MPHIKANDINIYYESYGEGRPLIIIGGFATTLDSWQPLIEGLSQDFKLILFDNRGMGQTEVTKPPYTIKIMAQDTIALMDALGLENAFILGHSMGSAILQKILIDHADRVNKAILMGSFAKVPYASKLQMNIVPKLLQANVPLETVIETVLPWIFSSEYLSNEKRYKKVLEHFLSKEINPEGYEGQKKALEEFDSTKELDKINTDTLILVGEEDIDTPIYLSKFLNDNIANSQLKILKNAAHMIPLEQTEEFLKIVNFFY